MRTLYDPFGGVEATQRWDGEGWGEPATTPITQTDILYRGDLLQRDLNLYLTGDGRTYDPWLGKHLQPDAVGGSPLLPQAADRYQYAGNRPMGVGGVSGAPWWVNLGGDVAVELAQGMIGGVLAKPFEQRVLRQMVSTGAGRLTITAGRSALERRGILGYFEEVETNRFMTKGLVRPWGRHGVYLDLETGKYFGLGRVAVYELDGTVADLNPVFYEERVVREVIEDSAGRWLAREVGIPFVVDFGFQLAQDWSNPRLPWEYKVGRATVSGVVGVAGGGIAYVLCWFVVGSTPPGWLLLVGGVIVGISVENPVSGFINERVFPEKPLNLHPLQ